MDQPGMIDRRPLPARTDVSLPFWDGLDDGLLRLPRCQSCAVLQYPPDLTCNGCGAVDLAWEVLSGRGTLYTWTIAHPPLLPFFAAQAPWPVVAVELAEGPRIIATLHGVGPEAYEIGMPVRATYERVADDVVLLAFEPDPAPSDA